MSKQKLQDLYKFEVTEKSHSSNSKLHNESGCKCTAVKIANDPKQQVWIPFALNPKQLGHNTPQKDFRDYRGSPKKSTLSKNLLLLFLLCSLSPLLPNTHQLCVGPLEAELVVSLFSLHLISDGHNLCCGSGPHNWQDWTHDLSHTWKLLSAWVTTL